MRSRLHTVATILVTGFLFSASAASATGKGKPAPKWLPPEVTKSIRSFIGEVAGGQIDTAKLNRIKIISTKGTKLVWKGLATPSGGPVYFLAVKTPKASPKFHFLVVKENDNWRTYDVATTTRGGRFWQEVNAASPNLGSVVGSQGSGVAAVKALGASDVVPAEGSSIVAINRNFSGDSKKILFFLQGKAVAGPIREATGLGVLVKPAKYGNANLVHKDGVSPVSVTFFD